MSFKLLDAGIDALRRVCIGRSALVVGAICVATAPSPSFAETPDAYLEYVASTGKQYVDTGIRAKSGIRAEMGMMWTAGNWYYATFLGARTGDDNLLLCHVHSTYRWGCFYGTTSEYLENISAIPTRELNKYYEYASEFTADGRFSATINGVTATATPSKNGTAVGALDTGLNLYLFARNLKKADGTVTSDLPVNARCYYLKIWTNDVNGVYVLARDLKPCVKGNIPGLYDKVTGEILYSGTSTALEAGPETEDVSLPAGAANLEYVQSAGNHHIDTGIQARSGSKLETGMMWLEGGNKAFLVGRINNGADFKLCHQYGSRFHTAYGANGAKQSSIVSAANTYYVVKSEAKGDGSAYLLDVNGATWSDTTKQTPVNTGFNFWLFAQNASNSQVVPSKSRCYYLKLWQTNDVDGAYTLVRNFLPCKDPSGMIALYDTVSKAYFYPNTGTLTAGPEVALGDVVWTGAAGTFALDNAANWSTGKVPFSANTVTIPVADGETVFTASSALAFGAVKVIGVGSATFPANVSMTSFEIAPYVTAKFAAVPGVADGGIKGAGTLVLDPGAGNTLTMTKNNTGFTGEAIVKSGVVKFGDATSFGPLGRAAFIRVKGGATLDEAEATSYVYDPPGYEKNKVILEDGATFVHSGSNTDTKGFPVTRLTLEGNATVDTSIKNVAIGLHYNYDWSHIDLGTNTLTVTGGKMFSISTCTISGTGTIDVQDGTTVASTHAYNSNGYNTTCANGTIRIREGTVWRLATYQSGRIVNLSTKNLMLDGQIVRDANTYTLTVTGTISGKGTTPMLTMGAGAVFKPTGTGYLTITESLSGTMTIDLSGLDLSGNSAIPLFKTGSAAMLPAENEIVFAAGVDKGGWKLRKTADGLGYDLARAGFTIMIR